LDQRGRAEYYIRVDSFWAAAVAAKLSGIRTKLLAGLLMLASFLVGMHDFLLPIAMGVDWSPLTGESCPHGRGRSSCSS
jgi:hypothetical protein